MGGYGEENRKENGDKEWIHKTGKALAWTKDENVPWTEGDVTDWTLGKLG